MSIAVIGLVHEAAAADIDTAYLRGTGPTYQVQEVGYPWYPTSAPAPFYPPISSGPIAPAPPAWFWTGFNVGGHVGAAVGTANFADPFGSSIFGDNVTTPGFLAGGQIGYNWQVPNSPWVLGVEADASWLTADGTNTCLAFSGLFVSATCHADPNAVGTLTGRVGYAFGPSGTTLIYAKGGAAWVRDNIDITTNNVPTGVASTSYFNWGWTVGGGVEHALTPAWSVRLEYDFLGFASASVTTPTGLLRDVPGGPFVIQPPGTTNVSQNIQEVKVGLNYKFGADPWSSWNGPAAVVPYYVKAPPVQAWLPGWDFEFGSRVWFSSGKFQWNDGAGPAGTGGNSDISRLTYDGLTGYTGEYFQRIDTPWGLFAKGNLGLGAIDGGHQNDEDWLGVPIGSTFIPYSNTLSSTNNGKLGYATVDLGYDVLRGPGYKVGPFVGYNYFSERWNTFGCTQIANQFSDCAPALPATTQIGTQDSTWQSLRVGANSEVMLVPGLMLTTDVAYLPYVTMTGQDNHLGRATTTFSDQQGTGQGVQLEAIMSYFVTDNFSVGVGGRYWAMWTTNGQFTCTGCGGVGVVSQPQTAAFNTERYGTFLQADYRFGSL